MAVVRRMNFCTDVLFSLDENKCGYITPSGCNVGLSTVKTLTWSPLHRNKESKNKNKKKKPVWKCLARHQEYTYKYIKRAIQKMSVTLRNALRRHFARFERYCKGIYMPTKRNLVFVFVSVRRGTCFLTSRFGFSFSLFQLHCTVKERAFDLVFYYIFLSSTCDTGMSVLTVNSLSLYIYIRIYLYETKILVTQNQIVYNPYLLLYLYNRRRWNISLFWIVCFFLSFSVSFTGCLSCYHSTRVRFFFCFVFFFLKKLTRTTGNSIIFAPACFCLLMWWRAFFDSLRAVRVQWFVVSRVWICAMDGMPFSLWCASCIALWVALLSIVYIVVSILLLRRAFTAFNWQNCRSRRCGSSHRRHTCTGLSKLQWLSKSSIHTRQPAEKIPPHFVEFPPFLTLLSSVLAFSLALVVDNVGCVFRALLCALLFVYILVKFLSTLWSVGSLSLFSLFVCTTTFVSLNWRAVLNSFVLIERYGQGHEPNY